MTAKKKRRAAGGGGKAGSAAPRYPERDVYTLADLEQVRVLADPLRVRILEAFCEERTTKQVAELLGEKPTKLYHHVEALERVGVIEMTRTRQNRGTLEKYFLSVAKTFRTDPQLFTNQATAEAATAALKAVAATTLETTAAELRDLIERGTINLEAEGALCYVELRMTGREATRLRKRIEKLLAELADHATAPGRDDERALDRYRLTLAYYPLQKK